MNIGCDELYKLKVPVSNNRQLKLGTKTSTYTRYIRIQLFLNNQTKVISMDILVTKVMLS